MTAATARLASAITPTRPTLPLAPERPLPATADPPSATNRPADPPLLPRVARGDADAVGQCLDRYGGLAWSIARRMLGPGQDAEDAVQDAFVDLWRHAERFEASKACESTFVAMIVRRRTLDRLRRRTSGAEAMKQAGPFEPDALPATTPTDRLEAAEEADAALKALDALPPPRGELVKLSVCEGLTHGQLAERFNLPLGTVKSHVRRGLQAVRDALGANPEATHANAAGVNP
ncbi:MAG: sigma-70 family RNA polymerase sigma factor [Planctomycetota bacterium]